MKTFLKILKYHPFLILQNLQFLHPTTMGIFRPADLIEMCEYLEDKYLETFGRCLDAHLMKNNSFEIEFEKLTYTGMAEFKDNAFVPYKDFTKMLSKDKLLNKKKTAASNVVVDDDVDYLEMIATEIYKKYEELRGVDNKKVIVLGKVQSGKTFFELSVIWLTKFVHKREAVFLLSNSLNSYSQVKNRDVADFNEWIDKMSTPHNTQYHLKIAMLEGGMCNTSDQLELNDFILAIGNPVKMTKVKSFLDQRNLNYDLIVDEADTFIKDIEAFQNTTKTGNIYDSLIQTAYNTFEITATPFANLNKKNNLGITMKLPLSPNYRGIDEVEFVPIDEKLKLRNIGNIGKLVKLTKECAINALPNPDGYTSILINASHTNKLQKLQAIAIKKAIPAYSVFVINTDDNKPSIKGISARGEYTATSFNSIHDLYQHLTENKTNNIIVSGFMASRANTYRPLKNVGCGGLSALIFVPTNAQHCAGSIQCMRIFGNYAENYPKISLYTTQKVFDNIKGETENYDTWIAAEHEGEDTRLNLEESLNNYVTCKHDRKNVDDTKNSKVGLSKRDYANWEAAFADIQTRFPGMYTDHKCLTTGRGNLQNVPDMQYEKGLGAKIQNKIRKSMFANKNDTNQVAWYKERYEELHDIEKHYRENSMYNSRHTTGDLVSLTNIPYITWDERFSLEYCDTSKMYWIYTTNNTVRIFLPNKHDVKFSKISHKAQ